MEQFFEPSKLKEIVGNQTLIESLKKWLKSYDSELKIEKKFKPKKSKFKRAALISGPVGIGHTLITKLLAKELKYMMVVFDCSNCKATRPKINENTGSNGMVYISEIQVSKALFPKIIVFETGSAITGTMATQIINLVKKTQVPIIINCNDPYPLKTLSNYCMPIKLRRPTKIQIINYLLSKKMINESEKQKTEQLIDTQGADIRHIVNSIRYKASPNKDIDGQFNMFSATEAIFNDESMEIRTAAFWEDYMMVPLMVQQNYIYDSKKYDTFSKEKQLSIMENVANAAEALSDYQISSSGTGPSSWSMLPINCYLVIRACSISKKKISSFPGPQFPQMLGKGSTERSNREKLGLRAKNIHVNPTEYRLDYVSFIYKFFMSLLESGNKDDIQKAIDLLNNQKLTRDDFFDIIEKVILKPIEIPSKNKSAFTRAYNKAIKLGS
jgi:DNA polymerase III delta prime subunit